jgi:prepilin-type N-terminal cleavage/methylation domain-containing protein
MTRRGFGLIESLIVISVVGILLTILVPNFQRWRATTAVKEAATQFASDLDKQRSESKKLNVQRQVVMASDGKSYSLNGVSKPMPEGLTLTGSTTPVSFNPPYGTVTTPVQSFSIKLDSRPDIETQVRVVGIVGKVILE